jgi:hypothetical protein
LMPSNSIDKSRAIQFAVMKGLAVESNGIFMANPNGIWRVSVEFQFGAGNLDRRLPRSRELQAMIHDHYEAKRPSKERHALQIADQLSEAAGERVKPPIYVVRLKKEEEKARGAITRFYELRVHFYPEICPTILDLVNPRFLKDFFDFSFLLSTLGEDARSPRSIMHDANSLKSVVKTLQKAGFPASYAQQCMNLLNDFSAAAKAAAKESSSPTHTQRVEEGAHLTFLERCCYIEYAKFHMEQIYAEVRTYIDKKDAIPPHLVNKYLVKYVAYLTTFAVFGCRPQALLLLENNPKVQGEEIDFQVLFERGTEKSPNKYSNFVVRDPTAIKFLQTWLRDIRPILSGRNPHLKPNAFLLTEKGEPGTVRWILGIVPLILHFQLDVFLFTSLSETHVFSL